MSELLRHEEYVAIAATLDLTKAAFIHGRYQVGSGQLLTMINPAIASAHTVA